MGSARYSCQILVELEFFRQILEKWPYIKCHENPSSGSWVVPCGRTDIQLQTYRHYVANSRFLQICERVYKPSDLTVAAVRSNCRCNAAFSPWKKIWMINGTVENKCQQFMGQCQLCVPHGTARSEIQLFLRTRDDSFSNLYELADHCNWDN
jgi:hypothetical protein